MKYLNTLNSVQQQLDKLGDLPVFSATVNRISQISSSRKSDAMALAMAVMKDANLSARLLRLANTSYYSRGGGRINVVSRAVVLLGFDQIKSLSVTLKLIEGFKQGDAEDQITDLLMRSFMTAAIAREVAQLCNVPDIEETYICGLLHGLGEILVAYTLPDTYQKMLQQQEEAPLAWSRIQIDHLGGHFSDIGQDIAQSWGFPTSVVQSMDLMTAEDHPGEVHGNFQIASMADQLLKRIYGHAGDTEQSFTEQLDQLTAFTGHPRDKLNDCINNAFKMACDMAREYSLPGGALVPPLRDSGDETLDEFTRKISYYMHTRQAREAPEAQDDSTTASARPPQSQPTERVLDQLNTLGDMVTNHAPIQQVLAQVMHAVVSCTGFDRAGFCLLGKDRKHLDMRISKGRQTSPMEHYFHLQADQRGSFFFKILGKGMTLLVTDTGEGDWSARLPSHLMEALAPRGFIMAPLGVGDRPLGFIYADTLNEPVSDEDFRRFNQFFLQTKMALAYSKQNPKAP